MVKTYLRLLSFAKPIEKFAIPYVIATLFAIIFNTLNLALLAPLLQTLFFHDGATAVEANKSAFDIMGQFQQLITYAQANYGSLGTLKIVCAVIVVSVILSNFFRYFSQRYMEDLRVHTLLNLRKTVFYNVMSLHLGYFNNERKGDIFSKIASDVQVVQYSVTNTLQVVFKEPLQLIFYVIVLLNISLKLTLFSLLVIPVSAFVISKIVKRLKQQARQSHETFAVMLGYLDEALSGIKIIKAFNATDYVRERFQRENEKFSNLNRKMVRRQQLASPVSEALSVMMVAGIVLYGGSLILLKKSDLSSAEFIAYIAIFSQIMRPAKALTDAFSGIHSGITAGERVLDLIDTKPTITDKPNAINLTGFNTTISLQKVSFSYGNKEVLHAINLNVPKGTTVALVGPSGGGKSTLMDLLPRFHETNSGSILIDGYDIRDVTMESLRRQMGIVNQESILFNDSIFNNIAFGRPNSTLEEVMAAAKIANAHEFILATEDGYETNIGDRGNKLSGGQKQRICIARAVLANPPIMLLDEATSALDTESEKLVQDALNKLMQNRTSIIIAHRLSTIQNADSIAVIDKGEVVETGTHAELMLKNGLYRRLIDMQTFDD